MSKVSLAAPLELSMDLSLPNTTILKDHEKENI